MPRCLSLRFTVTAALAVTCSSAHAQEAAARKARALERPLTSGAVALLAAHATDPAVQQRLSEALRHTDPAIRTVAARLAGLRF